MNSDSIKYGTISIFIILYLVYLTSLIYTQIPIDSGHSLCNDSFNHSIGVSFEEFIASNCTIYENNTPIMLGCNHTISEYNVSK